MNKIELFKRILVILGASALIMIVVFIVFAFAVWNLDVGKWPNEARGLYAGIYLLVIFFTTIALKDE